MSIKLIKSLILVTFLFDVMLSIVVVVVLCATTFCSAAILFDGRIPIGTPASAFEAGATPFNSKFVRGQNQTWTDIILPGNVPSLFDSPDHESFSLSLTDESIFVPQPSIVQKGFRRSELLPKSATGLTSGISTFHFSLMKDQNKPLNLSHEYQLVFIEPNDGTHVFEIKYGTGYQNTANPSPLDITSADQLRLMSSSTTGWDKMKVLFTTPFTPNTFHNFAITIDWVDGTLTAYYSEGNNSLNMVVPKTGNPTKPGEFHVGMVKLPTGPTHSIPFEGFQGENIAEALIFGGIFVENSTDGVVTTDPYSL